MSVPQVCSVAAEGSDEGIREQCADILKGGWKVEEFSAKTTHQ